MAQDSFEMNPTQLTARENASMPQDSDAEFSILSAMILSEEIVQMGVRWMPRLLQAMKVVISCD